MAGGSTIQFKKGFRPKTVEIGAKDEAIHFFETVALPRSLEKEVRETIEGGFGNFDANTTDEEALDVFLATIDKLIKPKAGKKIKASKVLKELWTSEEIESADVIDFLRRLFEERRPT